MSVVLSGKENPLKCAKELNTKERNLPIKIIRRSPKLIEIKCYLQEFFLVQWEYKENC